MKLVYIVLAIIILVAFAFIMLKLFRGSVADPPGDERIEAPRSRQPEPDDIYLGLRSQALQFPPDDFGIVSKSPIAYGVVMDWNVGRGILTFTSFLSGDASMYTSTGGGVIGGVGHNNVSDVAKSLVQKSQDYVAKANRSDDITTPREGGVKFFILTPQGRFVLNEELENFDNGTSPWLELFVEANKLITELTTLSEENQK